MSESWRWQLRDSEGQWVKMGSRVKWLSRGRWLRGKVVGSPRPDYATVQPEGGGPTRNIGTRQITVEVPKTHAQRNPTVTVPPEIYAGDRAIVTPAVIKVGDWVDLPAEDTVRPMDPNLTKKHNEAMVGQVTDIEKRGRGLIVTVTGERGQRKIPATVLHPPFTRIMPVQPKSDTGIGRPTRTTKAKVDTPAVVQTPQPTLSLPLHDTMETERGGDVSMTEERVRPREPQTAEKMEWVENNGVATAEYRGYSLRVSGTVWEIRDGEGRRVEEGSTEPMRQRHVVALPKGLAKELHFKAREVIQNRADEQAQKRDERAEFSRRAAEIGQESLSTDEITARIDAFTPAAEKNPRLANILMLARELLSLGKSDAARDYLARAEAIVGPQPQDIVKVKDAQPKAKSPAVKAAEKKALAVKTDTRLAEIYEARLSLKHDQDRLTYDIHRSSGSVSNKPRYSTGPAVWDRSLDEARTDFNGRPYDRATWERSVTNYQANQVKVDALEAEAGKLNAVYTEAGGWTRAFLVTNQGGHVHRSMSCSTCYPTTRFYWLPEYSGSDESQIVKDAGERACTVCYPSAPVDTRNRPTKIFSEDEKKQAVDRTERARAKVERDAIKTAKGIANPDGTELRVQTHSSMYADRLRTEVMARQWYVRNAARLDLKQPRPDDVSIITESLKKILEALAAKHSKTVEEIETELQVKVDAKVKQMRREGY